MMSTSADNTVWIVSSDSKLASKVESLLGPLTGHQVTTTPERLEETAFADPKPAAPDLVVVDIGDDIDSGVETIRCLRRARIKAPIVVLTKNFSRDFGAKIVSEGVRYYLAHDFCQEEFQEVAESLLKMRRSAG